MSDKMLYSAYEELYPETVILRKEGVFFNSRNNSARVIHAHFNFKGWQSANGNPTIGFRIEEIETVQQKLTELQISYMVIANEDIIAGQNFENENQFNKYINTSIDDFPVQKSMSKLPTISVPLLNEHEKKLNTISITYLERMLEGIHPVYNTSIPADSVLSDDNVKRCFEFVIDVLKKAGDLEVPSEVTDTKPSRIQKHAVAKFVGGYQDIIAKMIFSHNIKMSDMQTIINEHVSHLLIEPIKITSYKISNWLLENGYLITTVDSLGNNHREASEKGLKIGMENKLIDNEDLTPYVSYRFNINAQRFVYEHLDQIAMYKKKK